MSRSALLGVCVILMFVWVGGQVEYTDGVDGWIGGTHPPYEWGGACATYTSLLIPR